MRDNSNDAIEQQRIDTGGGDYMQQMEEELCYNNRFSPKETKNVQKMAPQKKKQSNPSANEEWLGNISMINRQASKKGINSNQFNSKYGAASTGQASMIGIGGHQSTSNGQ